MQDEGFALQHGPNNWAMLSCMPELRGKTNKQIASRWRCVLDPALVKGPFEEWEDEEIQAHVKKKGANAWGMVANKLGRSAMAVLTRWRNVLDPALVDKRLSTRMRANSKQAPPPPPPPPAATAELTSPENGDDMQVPPPPPPPPGATAESSSLEEEQQGDDEVSLRLRRAERALDALETLATDEAIWLAIKELTALKQQAAAEVCVCVCVCGWVAV